ncbi:MAG: hypothetical protein K0S44_1461 [Bacteroidetes bacterium]|nr:hypothetical protein [Bacteroidota bacterium]
MEESEFQNRVDLNDLKQAVQNIKTEVGKIIVGQEDMIELLIAAFQEPCQWTFQEYSSLPI